MTLLILPLNQFSNNFQNLISSGSIEWGKYQNFLKEINYYIIHIIRVLYLVFDNLIHYFFQRWAVKGWSSMQHFVKQNAQRPYISFWCLILTEKNFYCHVLGSATKCLINDSFTTFRTPSKITKFYLMIFTNENIFWFKISVNNVFGMQILHGFRYLLEQLKYLQVIDPVFMGVIEKISMGSVFHEN